MSQLRAQQPSIVQIYNFTAGTIGQNVVEAVDRGTAVYPSVQGQSRSTGSSSARSGHRHNEELLVLSTSPCSFPYNPTPRLNAPTSTARETNAEFERWIGSKHNAAAFRQVLQALATISLSDKVGQVLAIGAAKEKLDQSTGDGHTLTLYVAGNDIVDESILAFIRTVWRGMTSMSCQLEFGGLSKESSTILRLSRQQLFTFSLVHGKDKIEDRLLKHVDYLKTIAEYTFNQVALKEAQKKVHAIWSMVISIAQSITNTPAPTGPFSHGNDTWMKWMVIVDSFDELYLLISSLSGAEREALMVGMSGVAQPLSRSNAQGPRRGSPYQLETFNRFLDKIDLIRSSVEVLCRFATEQDVEQINENHGWQKHVLTQEESSIRRRLFPRGPAANPKEPKNVRGIKVSAIECPQSVVISAPEEWVNEKAICRFLEGYLSLPPGRTMTGSIAAHILVKCEQSAQSRRKSHCECALLCYMMNKAADSSLESRPNRDNTWIPFPFVAVSKLSCFGCRIFFDAVRDSKILSKLALPEFWTAGNHDKGYSGWVLPDFKFYTNLKGKKYVNEAKQINDKFVDAMKRELTTCMKGRHEHWRTYSDSVGMTSVPPTDHRV
ncbi:hypothetical protein EIP91_002890 [Steccherinum ochraceum]|uniref:Uncharacterized protein n=1 Tax=Steccherinum ochraceum TaxID=92696 RepID=A0A4R0S2E7_9APHY|nr:hypothetical protein EIP91_002890 [Steccherinum ochraceum]